MKKILFVIIGVFRDFIFNSFWKSKWVLFTLAGSLILNAILWYIFITKIKQDFLPFIFASGLIILNLILGNYIWERERLASFILITVGFFTQILMLALIRYLTAVI